MALMNKDSSTKAPQPTLAAWISRPPVVSTGEAAITFTL